MFLPTSTPPLGGYLWQPTNLRKLRQHSLCQTVLVSSKSNSVRSEFSLPHPQQRKELRAGNAPPNKSSDARLTSSLFKFFIMSPTSIQSLDVLSVPSDESAKRRIFRAESGLVCENLKQIQANNLKSVRFKCFADIFGCNVISLVLFGYFGYAILFFHNRFSLRVPVNADI